MNTILEKYLFLFICCFFITSSNYSQDTNYVQKLDYNSFLEGFTKIRGKTIRLEDSLARSIQYTANNPTSIGIGLNYKWLTLRLGLPLNNSNNAERGRTRKLFLGGRLSTRKFRIAGQYSSYKGFYSQLGDSLEITKNNGSIYKTRPDISSSLLYVSGEYIFNNDRISFRSAFENTEKQIKRAGSWILGANSFVDNVTALSPIDVYRNDSSLTTDSTFLGYNSFNIGVNGGYMISFVMRNVVISSQLSLPIYYTSASYKATTGIERNQTLNISGVFKLFVGFNIGSWFGGAELDIVGLSNENNITRSKIGQTQAVFNTYFGKRFNFGKKKSFKKI